MKRKLEWQHDESEGERDEELSDYEDLSDHNSEDENEEDPRIKLVLQELSGAVSQQRASDLLHSMAASKSILFWTPGGELLQNQRRIPKTNIAELLDYILLSHNEDIPKPKGLNSFLDGLAELGINKRGIKNEVALDHLIQKEREMTEETSEEEAKEDKEEEGEEEEEESEEGQDVEENDQIGEGEGHEEEQDDEPNKNTKYSCDECGDSDVNVDSIIACPRCCWHDAFFQHHNRFNEPINCFMCNTTFPLNHETLKSVLVSCDKCGSISSRKE